LKKEIYFNLFLFAIGIAGLYFTYQIPDPGGSVDLGASFFPKIILFTLLGLVSIQLLLTILDKIKNPMTQDRVFVPKAFIFIAIIAAYIISFPVIGYKLSTFILILILMYLLEVKKYQYFIAIPAGTLAFLFIVFEILLGVPLP